ncbi:uncharacterized protein SEPMUDRAFT_113431 [Sphaerulina musiva SO2202]|uniref:Uncharacterized protein n=1 Tax=Sphaerulina musiva (strain SO2202) TaxID=692275 RepID=N1QJR1_SPHMS|nr:uncharacterized protein SEPMUDRAFT_113431 [Sphaerulina musiva SO2202]EMF17440.1 hypothetical protein SEPMUDRAFT_113431 [Sphaerulina musiva SO2202]
MTTTFQEPGSASRECSACMDDHTSDFIMEVEGDPVCHDCIRQIFHFAIADDSNFPPVWSGTPLQLADFERILDASMISDFRDKAEKYSMLQRQGAGSETELSEQDRVEGIFIAPCLTGITLYAIQDAKRPSSSEMAAITSRVYALLHSASSADTLLKKIPTTGFVGAVPGTTTLITI